MESLSFFSADLNRTVTEEEVLSSTDQFFVDDVHAELGVASSEARAELEDKKKRAAVYGDYLTPEEFKALDEKRKLLGRFHQKIQRHQARLRRLKHEQRIDPLEVFFYRAAKNMLPPADFQRLVLIAEQRRSVASQEAQRKAQAVL